MLSGRDGVVSRFGTKISYQNGCQQVYRLRFFLNTQTIRRIEHTSNDVWGEHSWPSSKLLMLQCLLIAYSWPCSELLGSSVYWTVIPFLICRTFTQCYILARCSNVWSKDAKKCVHLANFILILKTKNSHPTLAMHGQSYIRESTHYFSHKTDMLYVWHLSQKCIARHRGAVLTVKSVLKFMTAVTINYCQSVRYIAVKLCMQP